MPPTRRSTRAVSSTAARLSAMPYAPADPPSSQDASSRSSASIARPANGKTSLRLTVKAPPSKLRQATSGSQLATFPANPYADTPSESDATPAPPTRTARSTRNPRAVVDPDSDEDEDGDGPGDQDESEGEGDLDRDLLASEESEEDAEADDDDMEDVQRDHPPPPVIKQERPAGRAKPQVTVTAPPEGPLKSVEDKEMEDEEDEDELSELASGEGEDEEDEDDEGSDEEDNDNSRSATPDLTKLTKRQRGAFEDDAGLLSLSNEAQKKKELTAEEHAMRRAEMARRRKNLSEKRNEEEKMDTINKLLSKPAPKRRTRAEIEAAKAAGLTSGAEDGDEEKPDPLYVRWVNNASGSRVGMPDEWLEAPFGEPFRRAGGRMVDEVA